MGALSAVAGFYNVAFKKTADSLPNYGFFLSQLIVLYFMFVFGCIMAYKYYGIEDGLNEETLSFPKWKLALISIFDAIAGVLVLIPASNVNGELLVLMLQGVVPATMLFSILILKKSFSMTHYIGTFLIIIGIVINTLPTLDSDDKSTPLVTNMWYLLPLFLYSIPAALSGICQEIALTPGMDISFVQLWVAFFQFLIGIALAPLTFLLQSPGVSLSQLPQNFVDGCKCWLPYVHFSDMSSDCNDAFLAALAYFCLCIAFNVLINLVVKYSSAATMVVANTVAVPLQFILFTIKIPFFNEVKSDSHFLNWVACAITVAGLVCYQWVQEGGEEDDIENPEMGSPAGSLHGGYDNSGYGSSIYNTIGSPMSPFLQNKLRGRGKQSLGDVFEALSPRSRQRHLDRQALASNSGGRPTSNAVNISAGSHSNYGGTSSSHIPAHSRSFGSSL
jgi:drug/metabolite transporter (DMT)-like permease